MSYSNRLRRWGIVLAGGDGVRLRPLTRHISGDDRPKQFCRLYGGVTLLEHTRKRAERSIRADRILFSLARAHESFYLPLLADCPSQRVVQPCNRGTVAAILTSLILIRRRDFDAAVAVLPSDHYYSDEDVATEAIEQAFDLAHREPDSVVLVGARPHYPEIEYGWIEVAAPAGVRLNCFRVRAFHEKPSPQMAQLLLERGSLWNTFVMVGKVQAFLEAIRSAMPGQIERFRQSPSLRFSGGEVRIEEPLYESTRPGDFSRHVLSVETQRLIVHSLGQVTWSDLGDCERTLAALSCGGAEPDWVTHWRASRRDPERTPLLLSATA